MRITGIEERTASIASQIKNAYIDFTQMKVSVVAIHSDVSRNGRRLTGYAFNSNGRYDQSCLLRERFIPRILAAPPGALLDKDGSNFDPHKVWSIAMANEKPGGHGERSVAVGVIDMALWDLVAKIEDRPLCQLLADRYGDGETDEKVFVYAAGGYYYPGKGVSDLEAEMRRYLDQGYSVAKMKIGGVELSEDIDRIEAVLSILPSGQHLAVDANGRFDLDRAVSYAEALQPYGLRWYEEPGDPLDYALQAELANHYKGTMATGENLFSMQDARNLLRYAGLRPDRDVLQMDPVLSYGLVEYLRMLEALKAHGFGPRNCIPHGGHQFALHIAAGLKLGGNESYPEVFRPFGGFADSTPVEDSFTRIPDAPGIGFEEKRDLFELIRSLFREG